jgi:hypothetical protein
VEPVSARAWSELLHAEVGYLLGQAGIPCLHIKGPTVALWLYEEGEREWGDVDIVVPPSRMDDTLAVLRGADMLDKHPGVSWVTSGDHAITLVLAAAGLPAGAEVDVHHRFPGIALEPERAFEELWRRREPGVLAHVELWFPDLATRALLIALNAGRGATPKAREDLRRLIAGASDDDWSSLIWLARRIDALPALRAGLDLLPEGREVVAGTALSEVEVSMEWRLRVDGAPRTALRLDELTHLPWRKRVSAFARWTVPPPAIIRMRDPRARGNAVHLVGGYLRRWRDGAAALGPSLAAVRRARRERGGTAPGLTREDPFP